MTCFSFNCWYSIRMNSQDVNNFICFLILNRSFHYHIYHSTTDIICVCRTRPRVTFVELIHEDQLFHIALREHLGICKNLTIGKVYKVTHLQKRQMLYSVSFLLQWAWMSFFFFGWHRTVLYCSIRCWLSNQTPPYWSSILVFYFSL